MTNIKILKVLNPVLALTFLTAAIAVTLYKYSIIPSLTEGEIVYKIHEITGKLFFLLGILHLILNWNWVKSQIFGIKPKPKSAKK